MNKTIRTLTAKSLLQIDIIKPIAQRILNKLKVKEIVKYQLNYIKKHQYHNFIGTINIHNLTSTGKCYLIDGQHRYEAIKILYDKGHNFDYNIEFVDVGSMEQLEENYKMLNQNTPLPEFPENLKNKSVPEETADYFQYEYPNVWNLKPTGRRPKIYFNHFQEALAVISNELKIDNKDILIELVKQKNKELSLRDYSGISENMLNGAKDNDFYFGLFLHTSNNKYFYQWASEMAGKTFKKTKQRIPSVVRHDTWDKYYEEVNKTKCPVCNIRDIKSSSFEAGHIVSEKDGGKATVDNLVPICGKCNKSMQTDNMEIFVKEHYPKNYDSFIKLLTN
jgi:hypothetical protein